MIVEVKGKQYIADDFGMFEMISGNCYLSDAIIGKVLFYKINEECVYTGRGTSDAFIGRVLSL